MKNEVLFTIYDFSFRKNTLYQVTSKLDSSAPDGFKEHRTTKVLNKWIANTEPGAVWNVNSNIWDTGLHESSAALKKAIPNDTERKKILTTIKNEIIKPVEDRLGKGKLGHEPTAENNHFWDNYRIPVQKDQVFNTEDPEDLLNLYLLIVHQKLTPQEYESHPSFKEVSQYCIVDKEDAIDRRQEKEMEEMEANGVFFNLLQSKKDDLVSILEYVGINGLTEKSQNTVFTSSFKNWLQDKTDGYQNSKVFLNTYKKFSTEDGGQEIYLHHVLKKLLLSSKGKVKQRKQEIIFDDQVLGKGLKEAAAYLMNDQEMQIAILGLLN